MLTKGCSFNNFFHTIYIAHYTVWKTCCDCSDLSFSFLFGWEVLKALKGSNPWHWHRLKFLCWKQESSNICLNKGGQSGFPTEISYRQSRWILLTNNMIKKNCWKLIGLMIFLRVIINITKWIYIQLRIC